MFTQSQNHTVAEAGRHPGGLLVPALLKQGQLQQMAQQVAQGHDQASFSVCKKGDSSASLSNQCQCLITFTVEMFGVFFLMFKWSFQYFSLCPWPTVLQLGIP